MVDVEDVIWDDMIGTTADYSNPGYGSTLQKTAAGDAANADAISNKKVEGNGFVEFRFGQTNKTCAVGLGVTNTQRTTAAITYAILGDNTQQLHVIDDNVDAIVGTYTTTDVFRVERTGTTVRFWKNGTTLLATSTLISIGALMVDTSFSHSGAMVQNCIYSGSAGIDDIFWKDFISTAATYDSLGQGSKLTASAATTFNADAVSTGEIPADGFVQFRAGQKDKAVAVGLAVSNTDRSNNSLNYAFELGANGRLYIRESGALRVDPNNPDPSTNIWFGNYFLVDRLRIERAGSAVGYYRNDTLLYTSSVPSAGALIVDTSFSQLGGYIKNAQYGGVSTAQAVVWQDLAGASTTTVNGNTQLTKTAATSAWDADAVSRKVIPGDGYVEWKFGATGKQLAVGLSQANTDHTLNGLKYAIAATGTGFIQIYESGIAQGGPSPWNVSDTLRIQRIGSTILYLQNGARIGLTNLDSSASLGSLLVDTAFFTPGGVVSSARMDGTKSDVLWRNLTNTTASYPTLGSGSTLTKTAGSTNWNADGVGETQLFGNGFVEFQFSQTDKSSGLGLSPLNNNNTMLGIAVGFLGQSSGSSGQLFITEYGVSKYTVGSYTTADVLKIERVGDQFYFYRNGSLLPYVSPVRLSDALWIDTAFYDQTAAVNSVEYYAPAQVEDIIWIDETAAQGTYPTPNQGSRLETVNTQATASGANSSKVMARDGFVQWRLAQTNADVTLVSQPHALVLLWPIWPMRFAIAPAMACWRFGKTAVWPTNMPARWRNPSRLRIP